MDADENDEMSESVFGRRASRAVSSVASVAQTAPPPLILAKKC